MIYKVNKSLFYSMSDNKEVDKNNFRNFKKKTDLQNIEIKKKINKLSYEESIDALETILSNIQAENISLDQIQSNYIEGQILLKHCEELLQLAEQEIHEINPDSIDIK
tara:strand:+ start:71 stop:394 length:324 start_codon:yes stop_codon:yes gene_type:complete